MDIEQNDLSVGFQTFNRQQIRAAIPDIINEFANSVQAMLMRTSISVEMAFVHSISQKISIVDVNTYNKDIENRARNITIWPYNSTLQPMKLIIFTKKKAKGKRVKWVKPSNGKGVHTNQHALWSPRLTWRKAVHTYQDAELESTMEFNKHKLVTLEAEVTNKEVLALYGRLSFIRAKRLLRYYLNGVDAFRLKLLFPHHGSIMKSKAPSKDKETQAHASSKALGEGVYRILRHKHKNDKKMQTRLIFKL